MPFGLTNAPAIISRVVVVVFKEFMHKILEVYFDYWKVFLLVNKHVSNLHKMNYAFVDDPFPTPFSDEILDNVGGKEAYSFTDIFSGYH